MTADKKDKTVAIDYLYNVHKDDLTKLGLSEESIKKTVEVLYDTEMQKNAALSAKQKSQLSTIGLGTGVGALTGLIQEILSGPVSETFLDKEHLYDMLKKTLGWGGLGAAGAGAGTLLFPSVSEAIGSHIYTNLINTKNNKEI